MFTGQEYNSRDGIPLLIFGTVEQIDKESGTISLKNGEIVFNIEMIHEEVRNLIIGQQITLTVIIQHWRLDNLERTETVCFIGYISKDLFDFVNQFTQCSGFGFKAAKRLYDALCEKGYSKNEICFEVANGNYDLISSTPGIGPKLAMRLIEEIKNYITTFNKSSESNAGKISKYPEAVDTLKSLGFVEEDIMEALDKIDLPNDIAPMDVVQKVIAELQK